MATYYIATTGNDSTGTGTVGNPYATIGKADTVVAPGDTVLVQPGTYTFTTAQVAVTNGTSGSRIVWQANGPGVHFQYSLTSLLADAIIRFNGNYTDVIGFEVSGAWLKTGISIFGHHQRVFHCYAHDCGTATGSTQPGSGFFDYRGVTTVGFNEWGYNTALRCGAMPNNFYHGFYVTSDNDMVHDNIASNCGGFGFHINPMQNGVIDNNLAFHNVYAGFAVDGSGGTTDFNTLKNNIAYHNVVAGSGLNGNGFAIYNSPGTHNVWTNNCGYLNTNDYASVSSGAQTITPVNPLHADPLFLNYQDDGSGNYHLQSGSPCIDAGLTSSISLTDFDGLGRPQGAGFDIGPYEWAAFTTGRFGAFMAHV